MKLSLFAVIACAASLVATSVTAQIPEYTVSKEMREDLYIDHQQDILDYLSAQSVTPTFIAVNNQWSETCSQRIEDMNVEIWVDGVSNGKTVSLILCYTPSKGVYLTKTNS